MKLFAVSGSVLLLGIDASSQASAAPLAVHSCPTAVAGKSFCSLLLEEGNCTNGVRMRNNSVCRDFIPK